MSHDCISSLLQLFFKNIIAGNYGIYILELGTDLHNKSIYRFGLNSVRIRDFANKDQHLCY